MKNIMLSTSCLGCKHFPYSCKAVNPPENILQAGGTCGYWKAAGITQRIVGSLIKYLMNLHYTLCLKNKEVQPK